MFVKEKCFFLGKIVRTHSFHGQLVLATNLSLTAKVLKEPILVELDGGLVPFYLDAEKGLRRRDHQSYFIHLDHIDNKEQAMLYVGCDVYLEKLPTEEKEELLKEPAFFEGLAIYNEHNEYLGDVIEVLDFSGNTLANVSIQGEAVLLPFTEHHILSVDMDKRKVKLHIPEGLLDM